MNKVEENKNKVAEKKKRTLLQRIVNVVLYTGIGFLVLLLILFGISQTSTFREFLRETIIEEANSTLNGKLYIEEIDGTIFTSLILRNTSVTMEKDTLLNAEDILVMTSPLQLLLKKIYIRDFQIGNASINLTSDQSGELNLTKLFPPSEEEADTTSSEFPFVIQVANLQFEKVNFSYKDFSVSNSSSYDSLNYNDIKIKDLNLNLEAKLDIRNNIYELNLNHLSFKSNVNNFNLHELKAAFLLNEHNIMARDFYFKTDRSAVHINALVRNLNIFDTLGVNLKNADLNLQAGSDAFSFDDLRVFMPSFNTMQGKIGFGIDASGTTEELNLNNLQVSLENSRIEGTGEIRNLIEDNLFISADLSDSYVDQNDLTNLLTVEIPVYPELGIIRFGTLTYSGSPLNFNSRLNISTDKGTIDGLVNLNLNSEPMQYDITLNTNELDIEPFANIRSSLNVSAKIDGQGITPETFDGTVRLFANGSSINGNTIDTLRLTADAKSKNIQYAFRLASGEAKTDLTGNFDFTNTEPFYKIEGNISRLNLAEFLSDTTLESNINFSLDAEGYSFDQDKLNLFMTAALFQSSFGDINIDSTRAVVDLQSNEGEDRIINIISDLADITVTGDFKIEQAADLIVSEVNLLSTVFNQKINSILPSATGEKDLLAGVKISEPLFTNVSAPVNMNYVVELKDFGLISAFIGGYNLEIDADIGGQLESTDDSVLFSYNTDMRYIKIWNDEEAYFITNMEFDLAVSNKFNAASTSDVELDVTISADRIFLGSEINDFAFNVKMINDIASIDFSAAQEPVNARLISSIDLSENVLNVSMDSLRFKYDEFEIVNKGDIKLTYNGDRIDINNFSLTRNGAEINMKGFVSQTENQNVEINLTGLKGKDLSVGILGIKPENSIDASINLNASVTGSMESPKMDVRLLVDKIAFGNKKFGELNSNFKYNNKNLDIDITFIDSLLNPEKPALTIAGYMPIDLSFTGAEDSYMETKPMDILIRSDGFNLGAFGDVLPAVNRLRGNFTSDLKLTGTPSSLKTEGFLRIKNSAFYLEANNLEYNASALINIEGKQLTLDSLFIANVQGTQNGGKMFGHGTAILDNLNITSSKFSVSGDLKVLSDASKSASPSVYGELVIGTDGNIEMELENERIFLKAPIIIRQGDLTFPQTQSAYGSSENYIYHFVDDTIKTIDEELDFDRLADLANKRNQDTAKSKTSVFDYDIRVTIEDEANITFVLSREFDQNLKAILNGNLRLEKYGTKTDAQGKLVLLEGSTLQFLKTLEAEGSITFESELSNPNLDIVATYSDYYYTDAGDEVPVEVRLSIKGPLTNLSKILITGGEDNIKVYKGAKNIADNIPNEEYDASDAAMFILLGQFSDDANQQDRDAVASTAAGLAGSLVGGFLNRQFGDAVKSVELRQTATGETRISLTGRAGNFRYQIGTSSDSYQDLSRSNMKIEYPVSRKLFLRLERKAAINSETTYSNEMINEFGVKYRFEF